MLFLSVFVNRSVLSGISEGQEIHKISCLWPLHCRICPDHPRYPRRFRNFRVRLRWFGSPHWCTFLLARCPHHGFCRYVRHIPLVFCNSPWVQLLLSGSASMHTESSYCQGHGLSPHLSSVFVAVLLIPGSLAHPLTGVFDQRCRSYNHKHRVFPHRRHHKNPWPEDPHLRRGK